MGKYILLCLVFLQNVILDCSSKLVRFDSSLFSDSTYMARSVAAGPFIVIEVETCDKSISANRSSISASVSTATPARPTSPSDHSLSESRPMRVGISKAVDSPVPHFVEVL